MALILNDNNLDLHYRKCSCLSSSNIPEVNFYREQHKSIRAYKRGTSKAILPNILHLIFTFSSNVVAAKKQIRSE